MQVTAPSPDGDFATGGYGMVEPRSAWLRVCCRGALRVNSGSSKTIWMV